MKRIFISLTLVFMLMVTSAFSAGINVIGQQQITTAKDGQYYFPRMSPDGNKVFFSKTNYKGLYYYDLQKKTFHTVTEVHGAGYQTDFSENGQTVFYRTFNFRGMKKYYSLISQDINSGELAILQEDIRDISVPKVIPGGMLVYKLDSRLQNWVYEPLLNKSAAYDQTVVFNENLQIALFKNGNKTILSPKGEGSYIYPSLSPDKQKLLFRKSGEGTYISDLDGNIKVELGDARAPQWSPDGKWIVYMVDEDDGKVLTASEIYVVSADGKQTFQLTDTNNKIEVYPQWGPDSKSIVYCTEKGEIFLLELNIN